MKIRELMDHGTTACTTGTTLDEAILTLRRLERDALPVTTPDGRVTLGIVDVHDIALALALHPRPACELTVTEAMRHRGVMVAPDDDVRGLCAVMAQHRARRVPVVDANGRLEGTVGVEELLRRVPLTRRLGGEPSAKDVLETLRALCRPTRLNAHGLAREYVEPHPGAAPAAKKPAETRTTPANGHAAGAAVEPPASHDPAIVRILPTAATIG